jgi:6-phosphogluconolactonase (cycloisomerase 2 family)
MRTHHAHCFRSAPVSAKTIAPKRSSLAILSTLALGAVLLVAPLQAQFVYVTNESDNTISAYSIGSNGALTAISGSPFPAGYYPISLAFDSATGLLYSGNGYTNPNHEGLAGTVTRYSINSGGALTPGSGSPFVIDPGVKGVTVNHAGTLLYVPTDDEGVAAFSIGSSGALKAVPGSPFEPDRYFDVVAIDPKAKFAYATLLGGILGYRVLANGALKRLPGFPFPVEKGVSDIVIDPTGGFLAAASFRSDNISVVSIGSDGTLTPVAGSPFENRGGPNAMVLDPKGRFLYVSNENNNTISGYKLRSDGSLTRLPNSPYAAGNIPSAVAVDSTGKFLYLTNFGGNSVSGYSINTDGSLVPVPGSPFATGTFPTAVLVTP